jgi:hypothetical protein
MRNNVETGMHIFPFFRYQQHLDPMMVSEWTPE